MPVSADLATDALVGVVTDDAAQQSLMDAEMPTTFPADETGVEESVARFIDNLSKQIFQAEDALTEGYDKLSMEKNVGLNPSDPVVQLAVLLGGSTTIGISYWLFAYGGYSVALVQLHVSTKVVYGRFE
ncbi:hypothetical protein ZWY2020_035641 [Hordeum vulgare]|nr:hypothetical protein ZWY2020_035641 [Hordeum vulgare]